MGTVISTRLRTARTEAGLSQAELARLAGTSQGRISSYETGAVAPTQAVAARLLAAARPRPSVVLARERAAVRRSARRHGLTNVRIFGSVARGTDRPSSDVDLLVTAAPGTGLFALSAFVGEVEGLLGTHVDVMTDGALDPASDIAVAARPL